MTIDPAQRQEPTRPGRARLPRERSSPSSQRRHLRGPAADSFACIPTFSVADEPAPQKACSGVSVGGPV